ncbi:MAG: SRPBCC family protein [Pseudomonadota bacterium]
MVKVVESTVLAAPVETSWELLRDFNGHESWHPAVADSVIESGKPADRVGCVRRFHLADGSELRERLLTLSDVDMAFSYCLLETPVPLLNYVAHVRLAPVTDGDHTFWHWESRFDTPLGREDELRGIVAEQIYRAGFEAIRNHLGPEAA